MGNKLTPLEVITLRLEEILKEKEEIEKDKTWKKHTLSDLRRVFETNSKLYKILKGVDYSKFWNI